MSVEDGHRIARMHLDLANDLYRRREELGYSVEQLAKLSGLASTDIEMIEEGDTTSLTHIIKLSTALDVRISISGDDGIRVTPVQRSGITWKSGPPQPEITTRVASGLTVHPSGRMNEHVATASTTSSQEFVSARH